MSAADPVLSRLAVTVATRRNARSSNEDAVGVGGWALFGESPDPLHLDVSLDGPVVVALADGMGGHPGGDVAARIAADHLSRPDATGDLAAAFTRADEAIHAAGAAAQAIRGLGATAAAIRVGADGAVIVGGVGDVRVYRVVDGYLGQLTVDDRNADQPGVVTRWLGGYRRTEVRVRLSAHSVRAGERLLLCTDGLHDAMRPGELLSLLAGEPRSVVGRLLAAAAGVDRDNITAVIVDALGAAEPVARAPRPSVLPGVVADALSAILPVAVVRPAGDGRGR
jgi:serine/threonine protein phosphatase PrpC